MSRLEQLATRPVGRLLFDYSLPAVVGMLVMQLYNVVDRIILGHYVGKEAIAGLTITFPVMNIATALGVLVGAGATARLSIALGAGDHARARHITGNALTLTVGIGVLYVAMFGIFIDPILRLFGADATTLPYAREFMLYILPGLLMTNLTFSFNNIMRAAGYPTRAMVTMFVGAGANIVLVSFFIIGLGFGIRGAALATDIAMTISMVFVMAHFVKPHGPVYFARHTYRPDPGIIRAIVSIGAAPAIVNIATCTVNILINNRLRDIGGVDAIAAAGVFVTVTSLLVCVILGLCQGMQPIAGYNYGAGNMHRLWRVYRLTVAASTVVSLIGVAAGVLAPRQLAVIFLGSGDAQLVDTTARALTLSMMAFWMVGFQIVTTNFFQSTGRVGASIFLSLTRQVIFLIPILLLLPHLLGETAGSVWLAFPASDFCATVVTVVMVLAAHRNYGRQQ